MGRKPYKSPKDVRLDTFAMRVNSEERQMLVALAERLQRTQSDAVRWLIREATRELEQLGLLQPANIADASQAKAQPASPASLEAQNG